MNITRRQFVGVLGAAPAGLALAHAAAFRSSVPRASVPRNEVVFEKRVYDCAGAVPPESLLRRCGVDPVGRRYEPDGVVLLVRFDSLSARAKAWDRFNTDPEWRALRECGDVLLKEISIRS